jgi:viroplasmin and RNaseH domain-containing protein
MKKIYFNNKNFKVIASPPFNNLDLYWESIKDFLTFSETISSQREMFSNQTLIELLKKIKASIMSITDLDNHSITFDKILEEFIKEKFEEFKNYSLNQVNS